MSSINTEYIDNENEIDISLNKDNSQFYTII
jgi:hypothetical protein